MNEMNKQAERRKRSLTWESDVVDLLARLRLLDFMPEETIRVQLQDHPPAPSLDPGMIKQLDSLLSFVSDRRLTKTTLRREFDRVLQAIGKKEEVIQISAIAESLKYVQGRLGLPIWPQSSAAVEADPDTRRRERLHRASQSQLFLQAMEIDDGSYDDVLWKESILLRFDPRSKTLLDWIEPGVQERLRVEAPNFKGDVFDRTKAFDLIICNPEWKHPGSVMTTLAFEYLRALANDDTAFIQQLSMPIDQTPIFDLIADGKIGSKAENSVLEVGAPRGNYLRFLSTKTTAISRLQGQVLYYLLRLDALFVDLTDTTIPPELVEIWPQPDSSQMRPTAEFRSIKEKYMEEFGIDASVFTKLWMSFLQLQLNEAQRQHSPSHLRVFWAARVLEAIRPDVYNVYRRQIDNFHELMHDRESLMARDEVWLSAASLTLLTNLSSDPLFYAVFHTEALGGRDHLKYQPGRGGREDRAQNVIIVQAHELLKRVIPSSGRRPVHELLEEVPGVPKWILESVAKNYFFTEPKATEVGPTSISAYITPLVLAMFGDSDWDLKPHKTKFRYLQHQSDPEVSVLNESSSAIRTSVMPS